MTGNEKNAATFADSVGGVWTITPNSAVAGHLDITAHGDAGPVTLTIPTCDAAGLAGRLRSVAMAEVFDQFDRETDRLEVPPVKPACDGTCGPCGGHEGDDDDDLFANAPGQQATS